MSHSRKQQGQYRKIIKDDNPISSVPSSTVPSVPPTILFSSSFSTLLLYSSTSTSSTSTSFTPVNPMPDNQLNEFIIKVFGDMYKICIKTCMDNYIIILSLRSWLHC